MSRYDFFKDGAPPKKRRKNPSHSKDGSNFNPPIVKPINILSFSAGTVVTPIVSSKRGDRSYKGEPLKFLGIANNQIIIQFMAEGDHYLKVHRLDYDEWSDVWTKYVDPTTLLHGQKIKTYVT